MGTGTPSIDPTELITTVDGMCWVDLQRVATAVLVRLRTVVEAPGTQRRSISISRTHPESSAPTAAPLCSCECASQHDHWRLQLNRAMDDDLSKGGEPLRFRDTVFRAAEDLHQTTHARRDPITGAEGDEDTGPDRADFICTRYQGIPSRRATWLESRRSGPISLAAFRALRARCGYGMELGEPRLPPEYISESVIALHFENKSDRYIASVLDISRGAVAKILAPRRAAFSLVGA